MHRERTDGQLFGRISPQIPRQCAPETNSRITLWGKFHHNFPGNAPWANSLPTPRENLPQLLRQSSTVDKLTGNSSGEFTTIIEARQHRGQTRRQFSPKNSSLLPRPSTVNNPSGGPTLDIACFFPGTNPQDKFGLSTEAALLNFVTNLER